jgi:hypothetical protein
MKIVIIDGQGGKIGAMLISGVKKIISQQDTVICIGTNSAATAAMLKAGADNGATGENPVVVNAKDADIIMGTAGIVSADSLFGEITPKMAVSVGQSPALKILIPFNKCNIYIAGAEEHSISECIDSAIKKVKSLLQY